MWGDLYEIRGRPLQKDQGVGSKIAFTVTFPSILKAHVFVVSSLQGLPVHPVNFESVPSLAVKVTGESRMYISSQSSGQLTNVSLLVTVPVAPFLKVVSTLSLFGP